MKKSALILLFIVVSTLVSSAQMRGLQMEGKEVFKHDDIVFHQIDDHTWVGNGHLASNESLFLGEGNEWALLINAGTEIKPGVRNHSFFSFDKLPAMV